ncbi:uncharacterized protein [Euwallacea fornicatus]|uniref:uncharacterized protein n=1 Tax=Euwallacea fornicatus TaxID=995702 RepID=UPI00338F853D
MWKFVTILILATSTASPLQVTPEQLHNHFESIQNQIQDTQNFYIGFEYIPFWTGFDEQLQNAKTNLTTQLVPYLQSYREAMMEILVNFKKQDIDTLQCVQAVNDKVTYVSEDFLTTTVNNLTSNVDQFLGNFYKYIITMDESFKELKEEILACNDSTCATDLDATLDKLYGEINDEEATIEQEMNKLIDEETTGLHLDETYYNALIQDLIEEVRLCVK